MLKNIKIYTLFILTLGFIACSTDNEVEPLFEADIDSRVDAQLDTYRKAFISSEFGWKTDYRPKNEETGIYNVYLKFNSDNSVEIVSDHNNGTDDLPSTFRVGKGHFPELVFENYSAFHSLFEAEQFRLGAEYEFIIKEVSENMIKLESKTDQGEEKSTVTLVKATATDKENVEKLRGLDERVKDGHLTTLSFRGITVTNSSSDITFSGSFSYDELTRVGTVRSDDADGKEVVQELAIELTEIGFDFVDGVTFSGTQFKSFSYDEVANLFTSTVDGNTAVISASSLPLYINNDIFGIGESPSGSRFLYRPGALGDSPLTSTAFRDIVAQINANASGFGLVFEQFIFTTTPSNDGIDTRLVIGFTRPSDGEFFTGIYDFESTIEDKKLKLTYLGPNPTLGNPGNSGFFESIAINMINFFSNADGLIYTDRGSFRSDTSSFSNDSATLLSVGDPSLSVYAVWF